MLDIIKKLLKKSFSSVLSVYGTVELIVDDNFLITNINLLITYLIDDSSELSLSSSVFSLSKIIFLFFLFLARFIYLKRKLIEKNSVKFSINGFPVTIENYDIFNCYNCKRVIAFDECYTSTVGENPEDIKISSICGQYLSQNPNLDMRKLIEQNNIHPETSLSLYQQKIKFKSGTIVPYGDDFLLAFTPLDKLGRSCITRDEYIQSLFVLWEQINIYDSDMDLCLPLLGAGVTCFDGCDGRKLSPTELLENILLTYKLTTKKLNRNNTLRIVIKDKEIYNQLIEEIVNYI